MISECEGEKGNFLCGPEWRVKITTRADQRLEVQQVGREQETLPLLQCTVCSGNPAQVQDGADYRVLISPLPPIKEEAKEEVEAEEEVKTVVKEQRKVSIKKVVKVEVKSNGLDER